MSIGCAGAEDIPEPTCEDLNEWETEVNELADAILWDVDYEDAQLYIDFSPEKSKRLRENRDSHLLLAEDSTQKR